MESLARGDGLFKGSVPADATLAPPTEDSKKVRDWLHTFPRDLDSDDTSSPPPEEDDTTVYILCLERLGGKLPVGRKLREDIIPEVLDMYTHLAYLGIQHVDIRHANILQMPEPPPGWPSLVSPYSDNVYRYRIIDFECSRKTNWTLDTFDAYYEGWVERLLDGLPLGYVLEISDF